MLYLKILGWLRNAIYTIKFDVSKELECNMEMGHNHERNFNVSKELECFERNLILGILEKL